MTHRPALYAAFVLSGVAGLVYEVLWSRYLTLFVGAGAFAQVLVLAVYLGGMAVGAWAVSARTREVARPLLGYAVLEGVLGMFGLLFHPLYQFVTGLGYDAIFPALGDPQWVGAVRWGLAGMLILPQAMVLGATFPLLAAGLLRLDPDRPGGAIARAYLLNTLGGAAGVLLAGFAFVGWFGLAGTSVAAAVLNFAAAGLVWTAVRGGRASEPAPTGASHSSHGQPPARPVPLPAPGLAAPTLTALLLPVAFGTAAASFTYEIGWIRMLSLLLGSATHAFELMLSAFILGLALGAWVVHAFVDRVRDPVRTLGLIQVGMGLAALASIPVYAAGFEVVAWMVESASGRPGGYALFNLGRYGLALVVMLPATLLAGMTLPLLTATLVRSGAGETAIGRVYALNTVGSVTGAVAAGLAILPLLGLKGTLVAGAALDVGLGLVLLAAAVVTGRRAYAHDRATTSRTDRTAGPMRTGPRAAVRILGAAMLASAVAFGWVGTRVDFDQAVLTGGAFRYGEVPDQSTRRILYYQDGRTATVSAHILLPEGITVMATNGKPDASIDPLWRIERRDTLPETPIPIGSDFSTQLLSGLVGLGHQPDARNVANVGHGSGITGVALLTSDRLERLVNIEIEPFMVEASLVFLPTNAPVFQDPRSTFVFDDAKSFFAYRRERFDLIVTEPSNPWVSGTAALFTREFYHQARRFLTDDGVLVQWMQLYELTDDLFLTVLAALDEAFGDYRVYLIGEADVAIVASPARAIPTADWSVVASERVRTFTTPMPEILPQHMEALLMFEAATVRPLLARGVRANSDFRPILDLGAERARFDRAFAAGVYSFATSPFDLARMLRQESVLPHPHRTPPARAPISLVQTERGAWLREAVQEGGAYPQDLFPEWDEALIHLETFLALSSGNVQLGSWETWALGFSRAAGDLHRGTSGWTDETFFRAVEAFLDRAEAPPEARAVVALHRAVSAFDWASAATAADLLVHPVAAGGRWMQAQTLLDAAVVAYLRTARPADARTAYDALVPGTGRADGHMRHRLLDALIEAGR